MLRPVKIVVKQKKKKLSLTSFQLKGGGWYKDGYANQKKKKLSQKQMQQNQMLLKNQLLLQPTSNEK